MPSPQNSKSDGMHLLPKQVFILVEKILKNNKVQIIYPNASKSPNTLIVIPNRMMTFDMTSRLYTNLHKALSNYYPQSYFYAGKDETLIRKYKTILVNANKDISIKIFAGLHKTKTPEVLRPGIAFELYFESIIKGEISKLKDLQKEYGRPLIPLSFFNLTLNLFDNKNKNSINIFNIVDAKRVGQTNDKPDVELIRRLDTGSPRPTIKISLKQGNFGFWSSANTYRDALEILDRNISDGIVSINTSMSGARSFSSGIRGIYVPATKEETKKFCFGEGKNKVEYIVINSKYQGIDENFVMNVICEKIYRETSPSDLNELMKDVYLLIEETEPGRGGAKIMKGFDIKFVNGEKIKDKEYIKGIR
ncbi:MAG: hypothetical protein SCG72_05515 [Nitrosarchaeum sp.]|nr:hypothetical protein [Nitrosarchaeum sp.]